MASLQVMHMACLMHTPKADSGNDTADAALFEHSMTSNVIPICTSLVDWSLLIRQVSGSACMCFTHVSHGMCLREVQCAVFAPELIYDDSL